MSILLDTSILLRRTDADDARHLVTLEALDWLTDEGETLVVARQNLTEFRGVASRPKNVNGLGMTPAQADAELDILEQLFDILPERDAVYAEWRRLCRAASVSGRQVHDTRLAAVCFAAGIETILTWNPSDFTRFVPLAPVSFAVLTPADALASP